MNFRVTVHDDHFVGSCADYISTFVTFDASAGPFVLTYPSATNIFWAPNTTEIVTWNVANTNNSSVNCQFVDIYLSTNGGLDYPILLVSGVPNTGSASVLVPDLPNTTSRIMVMASNGTFFDISDNNFTINDSSVEFNVVPVNSSTAVCQESNATFSLNITPSGSFSGQVSFEINGLPNGAEATWSSNPASVPSVVTLTVSTFGVASGTYPIQVIITGIDYQTSTSLTLGVNPNIADASFTLSGQNLVASQSFALHQWLDCSTIPPSPIQGATNSTFVMTSAIGSYALQATAFGCVAVSDCFDVNILNVHDIEASNLQIYPNPTDKVLFISWNSNELQMNEIRLYDASGQLVRVISSSLDSVEINLQNLSSGMYYLELRSSDQIQFFKVVKN
jgi:hypothetical protein